MATKAANASVEDRVVIGEDREDGEDHAAAVVDMDSSTTRVAVVVVVVEASAEGDRTKMPQLMQ